MSKKLQNNISLKDDVAIKYLLKMHTVAPSYPTQSDFMFDCVGYYLANTKKSQVDLTNIQISKTDLKAIFNEKLSDVAFVQQLKAVIREMMDINKIKKSEIDPDILIFNKEALTELYNIT